MINLHVYIGSYTSGGGEGISHFSMDPDTGALRLIRNIVGVVNPSFLALNADRHLLYAVNEVEEYYGKPEGALSAFLVDPENGDLHFLNQQSSKGSGPCSISLDRNRRFVLVANYGGGSIASFHLEESGRLGECLSFIQHQGSGPNPTRQASAHAHTILASPDNTKVLAVDLGLDRILTYAFDPATGILGPAPMAIHSAKPGSGPRDLVFHPNGHWAYVVHELESLVCAYAFDSGKGSLRELQFLSSLPAGAVFPGENYGACAQVDQRGRFLYVSNRGHDSIVIFRIDGRDGTLAYQGSVSTGGIYPRHFALDPTGRFLLVANQKSDSLVVFKIDAEDGRLLPTGQSVSLPTPVCVLITRRS